MTISQLTLVNIGALITAAGGVFLKQLSNELDHRECIYKIIISPNLWLASACYVAPVLFWLYLLKTMELTKLQPMLSVVYVYSVAFALIFLGEQLSLLRFAGIFIILIGVIIVGNT